MTNKAISKLMKIRSILLTVVFVSTTTAAYTQTTESSTNSELTGIGLLFSQSKVFLINADKLCDTNNCHAIFKAATDELANGMTEAASGTLQGAHKQSWHARFGTRLLDVQDELIAIERRQEENQPVTYLNATPHHACLQNVVYTCDQVFAAALAICSLYSVASPIAAAI